MDFFNRIKSFFTNILKENAVLNDILTLAVRYRWFIAVLLMIYASEPVIQRINLQNVPIGSNMDMESIYNLFFPIYPLNSFVFPFRTVMVFLWKELPDCLSFLKYSYLMLPAMLAMAAAIILSPSRPLIAGLASYILSMLVMAGNFSFDLEQYIISSAILISIAAFYSFENRPKLRIVIITAALCVCMSAKGTCLPFCIVAFAMLFYEAFKSRKNRILVSLCFLVFIASGMAWSWTVYSQKHTITLFTETSSRLIPNLVAGAHGFVRNTEGDVPQAFGLQDWKLSTAVAYSVRTVASNPVRYLKSIATRFAWLSHKSAVFAIITFICLFSLTRLKTARKSLLLFLACLYFFCIYITMALDQRYFIPSMFLMCAYSGIFIADIFPKIGIGADEGHILWFTRKIPSMIVLIAVISHFSAWTASTWLLCTFQHRYETFDAEKYLARHPGNRFLLAYPLREGYPRIQDFEGQALLYDKTEKGNCSRLYKRHWLDFMTGNENTDNISCPENEIYWQDMLLDSFKEMGQDGNEEKAVYDIQTALLACMLSHGYVKQQDRNVEHTGELRQASDNLALSQAETCSSYFEKAVYTLPERHRSLRYRLLNSEAYYMMFPEKAREMFIARNSDKCDSCCVSHGEALPPIKCGIRAERLAPSVPVPPVSLMFGLSMYDMDWQNVIHTIENIGNEKERIRRADIAIRMLTSYLALFDDQEIADKAEKSPEMKKTAYMRYRPEAAYSLSRLHYLKGDKEKAGKYLVDTMRYSNGVEVRQELSWNNLMNEYLRLQRTVRK